jgi:hypothetical protein
MQAWKLLSEIMMPMVLSLNQHNISKDYGVKSVSLSAQKY